MASRELACEADAAGGSRSSPSEANAEDGSCAAAICLLAAHSRDALVTKNAAPERALRRSFSSRIVCAAKVQPRVAASVSLMPLRGERSRSLADSSERVT
eukprot:1855676-Pleurochrysis_carterae.AAC.1